MKNPLSLLLLLLALLSAGISFTIITYKYSQSQAMEGPRYVAGIRQISAPDVTVGAFIGQFRFTITGYTSPFATVKIEGQGIYAETIADAHGWFSFEDQFSPLSPREACLTAIDTDGRVSSPLCLPPFSVQKNVVIGPIILPPTVSLTEPAIAVDEYGGITGKGVPYSTVDIDLYPQNKADKVSLSIGTDENGDYSLTVPTEHENTMRVYSQNTFLNFISDKSNTLTIIVAPLWKLILGRLKYFLDALSSVSISLILFIEGLVLLALFLISRRHNYPLALRPSHDIEKRKESSLTTS